MRYQGSKARIAKELIPIMTQNLTEGKVFVDLFGGGMNLIDKVDHPHKIGCDINEYVIALWNELKENGMKRIPNSVTKDTYNSVKESYINKDWLFPAYYTGYVATCCSYGGGWFNGYANYNPKKNEDHIQEAYNGLRKQLSNFKHLETTNFIKMDYREIGDYVDLHNCVIYCDPPYESTKRYKDEFDNTAFWEWVRNTVRTYGTEIYVSEYDAPEDFKCVWQKSVPDGMGTTKNGIKQNRKIEKLFIYGGEEIH